MTTAVLNESFNVENRHDDLADKIGKKRLPPSNSNRSSTKKPPAAVFTSTKQSMSYVTVKAIESDTSTIERDWPLFVERELMENASDFLEVHYPNSGKQDRLVVVSVYVGRWATADGTINDLDDPPQLQITVRNSNIKNIQVFQNLEATFDFSQWYSSKRNQHRMTGGYLGDALKRILGMGYASVSRIDTGDSFEDKQWNEPLTLRFNDKEYQVFIRVNKAKQEIKSEIRGQFKIAKGHSYRCQACVEVEAVLPLLRNQPAEYYRELYLKLFNYFKTYKIVKSCNTDFRFEGSDDCGSW